MICSTCFSGRGHFPGCPEDGDGPICCEIHTGVETRGDGCAMCLSARLFDYYDNAFGYQVAPSDIQAEEFEEWLAETVGGDAQENASMVAMLEGMPGYVLRKWRKETCPQAERLTILIHVCMDCEKYIGITELEGALANEDAYGVSHGLCDECSKNH